LHLSLQPSFKFDPSKNFLTSSAVSSNIDAPPPIISFKPQQFASVSPQSHQKVQIVQQQQAPPAPVTLQKIAGTSGTILIRAQTSGKPQFTSISKVQETAPPPQFTTFRKASTEQFTMKTQSGQTLLLQPKGVFSAPVQVSSGLKAFTLTTKIPPTSQKVTISASKPVPKLHVPSAKPIPIRPRTETPQVISNVPSFARFNAQTQKWSLPGVSFPAPVPALTLIQPKVMRVDESQKVSSCEVQLQSDETPQEKVFKIVEREEKIAEIQDKLAEIPMKVSEEDDICDESDEEQFTEIHKTPEKLKTAEERRLEVMRIIEGDQDEIAQQAAIIAQVKAPEDESDDEHDSSSSMLLCDEKIESISPEVAEKKPEKSEETPEKVEKVEMPAGEVVKKKLELEENDKENVAEESEVEDVETEIVKVEIEKTKPKRVRKPKNPTIIATLGLPYKPAAGTQRKSKVEKKLEFELDFHDPVNKIQWDDGIGGLSNCNKLFGFDEFGLIEVLSGKDAMAKLNDRANFDGNFNLRKISDPVDQFVCCVCAKLGTIRDFYSPECCSESCLAITKRKSPDAREESSESGMTTPVDERKLMFGGEMIPLQQLQQQLLEQQLPASKRQRSKKRAAVSVPEAKFQWDTYLTPKSVPAPVSLFKSPYPRAPNPFKVGMKLEAIDPQHQRLFCVCTVEEKLGYRIKLHFDGFSSTYDFWVNADSPNIFPAGYCQSSSRVLQTPPKWSSKKFDWSEYLDFTNSIGAQRALFPRLGKEADGNNPFEEGMKLEVMSKSNLYVGSVVDMLESRVLVEFNEKFEWFDIHSPYLHPCNYHKTLADPSVFVPPFRPFEWKNHIKETRSKEAPAEFLFFRTRSVFDFESGMKLEVVDAVNRQLIRPATVLSREEYKIHVLFDGFDITFGFWLEDDSEDIHPINWSEKTGHPIEHPAGFSKSSDNGLCPTAGCRGIGNGRHSDRYFHDNAEECPYDKDNWVKLMAKEMPSRIDSKSGVRR
jgi:lethal(3)malignant brain tumor-like protein